MRFRTYLNRKGQNLSEERTFQLQQNNTFREGIFLFFAKVWPQKRFESLRFMCGLGSWSENPAMPAKSDRHVAAAHSMPDMSKVQSPRLKVPASWQI
jgi:hypothetical protein